MKTFSKLFCFSLILTFILNIFTYTVLAANIDIDGIISTHEWENSQSSVILQSKNQSGNNIDFAEIKTIVKDSNTIYLALKAVDTSDEYLDDCGIQLTIPAIGTYTFGVDHTSDYTPNDDVAIDYSATADLDCNFFIELELTFKKAITDDMTFKVQIKDGSGILSRESEITDINIKSVENETTLSVTESSDKTEATNSKATTKYSSKSTTKFSSHTEGSSVDADNTSASNESTSEFIAKSNSEKSSSSKITKIILTVLAVLLILGACSLLIFAKPSEKKQDKHTKDNDSDNKE